MEGIKDDRFSHIPSDPRFKVAPKSVRKVKIDKRFQSLFTDKRFQVQYTVDKRGRHVHQSSQENFRKYYEISSDDESSEDSESSKEENEETKTKGEIEGKIHERQQSSNKNMSLNQENTSTITPKASKTNKWVVTPSGDLNRDDNVGVKPNNENSLNTREKKCSDNSTIDYTATDKIEKARMTDEIKMKLRDPKIDYARGMGNLMSNSSSSEESSEDSESEDESVADHGWGELDRDAERTEEATDRLAVLHMDWDRIRAVDLMVLFNSFLPPEGVIESVIIYPSQFGAERMKEEEEKGPKELVEMKTEDENEFDAESKEGKRYHMERLRQYQLNRLKYYYAILKFDSAETAEKVYSECDGLEYESSATKLDLRFVPQEETFDQEPREECTSMPDPAKYEPRIFTNTALQQGKVELTWDEMDPERLEFTRKVQKNTDSIDTTDIQAFLASSSDEDDDDNNDKGMNGNNSDDESSQADEKEEDRISRYKSLLASLEEEEEKKKNKDIDLEITWGVGLKEKAEKSIKEKLKTPQTPFEEMLEKRRQKKKMKRESKLKLETNKQENDSDDVSSDDDIPSDVDMNDPYFKEELQGFKKKKKCKLVDGEEDLQESKQQKAELELLLLDENDSETQKSHFNPKSIQEQEKTNKKKRRKQLKKKPQEVLPEKDDFEVNVNDARFSALFTSHHFNIDPADSQFRNTKAMQTIHSEKLKRRHQELEQEITQEKQTKTDPELSLLVKSIKNKTKHKVKK